MTDQLRCPRCGLRKPLADFPPAPSRSTGVGSYCRPCKRDHARERRSTPEGLAASRVASLAYYYRKRDAARIP
ncbi:hypothetical protein [Microbacterium sp. UBA3486]|uniref:hypothetical protein n=1 Tax=Microbacterium TaxID=33882 RepID=UPI0025F14680|nr:MULTISPECIES: hypothetical protein [Microbacterium]